LAHRQLIIKKASIRPPATPEEELTIKAQNKAFAKRAARKKLNQESYNKPEVTGIREWHWHLTDTGRERLEKGIENWDPMVEDLPRPQPGKQKKGKEKAKKSNWEIE